MNPASAARTYAQLSAAAAALGLACRGGFHPAPEDVVPALEDGRRTRTLILLGFTSTGHWTAFRQSSELQDGLPDPLDRWSRRMVDSLARISDATAIYPFTGPPWWPFQRWARRAEPLHVSPLGLLIHPQFGLWHAYRGALAFDILIDLPALPEWPHPCKTCRDTPCLRSCPVDAIRPGQLDAATCRSHVRGPDGGPCLSGGCLARRACPIGAEHRYGPEQAEFHMNAFRHSPG